MGGKLSSMSRHVTVDGSEIRLTGWCTSLSHYFQGFIQMVENFHAVLAMSGGRFVFRRFPFPLIPAGLKPQTNGGGSPRRWEDFWNPIFFLGSLKPNLPREKMIHQIHSLELTFSTLQIGPWKGDSYWKPPFFSGYVSSRECNSCEDIFKKLDEFFVGDLFFFGGVWLYTIESWVSRQLFPILPKWWKPARPPITCFGGTTRLKSKSGSLKRPCRILRPHQGT